MTRAVGLDFAQRSGLGSFDVAGADAVALDVVLAVFGADVAGQHLQTALSSCVCGNGFAAQFAHHGANVDDLAVALLDHAGDNCLSNDEGSNQVDVNNFAEVFAGHFDHGDTLDDACVVNQNVNAAQIFFDLPDQSNDVFFLSNVAVVAVSFGDACFSVVLDAFVHALFGAAVVNDLSACLCQSGADSEADAVGAAGNQSNLAFQRKCVLDVHENTSFHWCGFIILLYCAK